MNPDGFGGFVTEGNLHVVNAVDGGIAGRSAAQSGNARIRDKAHVHEVVLNGLREVEGNQDACFADLQLT
jgi:cytoskeletal protein CcmA (bactofilin family)